MPRETIHTPHRGTPDGEPRPFSLSVGWSRDAGDVQVGVTANTGHHLLDAIYGDVPTQTDIGREFLKQVRAMDPDLIGPTDFKTSDHEADFHNRLGRCILDAVTGSSAFGGSVWAHPDRSGINRLIATLRKARDAAFGKDE